MSKVRHGNISFNPKIVTSISRSQFIDKFLKIKYFKRYKKEDAIEILDNIYNQSEKASGVVKKPAKKTKAKKDDDKGTDKKDK